MEKNPSGDFFCSTHSTVFLPALLRGSPLWRRVQEGLRLFGVPEDNLTAVTAFRLDMVQRPRFTAHLFPSTPTNPGAYGFLLGDAANAIHFWPGRGLNSGLAAADFLGALPQWGLARRAVARRPIRAPRGGDVDAAISAQEPSLATDGDDRRGRQCPGDQGFDRPGDHRGRKGGLQQRGGHRRFDGSDATDPVATRSEAERHCPTTPNCGRNSNCSKGRRSIRCLSASRGTRPTSAAKKSTSISCSPASSCRKASRRRLTRPPAERLSDRSRVRSLV